MSTTLLSFLKIIFAVSDEALISHTGKLLSHTLFVAKGSGKY